MDDGLIEVIALDSSDLPITQVLGLHSKSVVQCKNVVITTTKVIHMKVDGEPVLMKKFDETYFGDNDLVTNILEANISVPNISVSNIFISTPQKPNFSYLGNK